MPTKRKLTDAERVWNWACHREGEKLRGGNLALGALLHLNGNIQNGGVCHAFDLDPAELAKGIAGFKFFGLDDLVAIIKPHEGEEEHEFNGRYYSLEGRGGRRIWDAFCESYRNQPELFAPLI